MVKMADRIVNLLPPPKSWTKDKIADYKKDAVTIHETLKPASQYLADRLKAKTQAYGQA
jgi:GTP diphosphokinase / guanosine-3',5'-bis(diphosphate) 3'-diphosphatase